MQKIMNRKSGKFLTKEEASSLCSRLKRETGTIYEEHKSVFGYATKELAVGATLRPACENFEGYTFAFADAVFFPFEGYKVYVLAIKKLPEDFEKRYSDYVVIGE